MKLHDLQPAPGSTKSKRRVGRGIAGKGGKTAGRGTKGQKARRQIPHQFEGGQLPLLMRVPKLRGFNNPFRVEYTPVNLDALAELGLTEVTLDTFVEHGLAKKKDLVKVLGRGTLSAAINVTAHGFSQSAEAAIVAAGGTVTKAPMPFGGGRPAAQGNAHANR
ncbi:MAG: 50S ribosomal protein L15 [Actinomycetes bacterium]|jgi:large subunit ribosomal protein L15